MSLLRQPIISAVEDAPCYYLLFEYMDSMQRNI